MFPKLAQTCVTVCPDLHISSDLAKRFDEALLCGPMVLIDTNNQGCGTVPDTTRALAALACGRAVTWAAQVRPGIVAIDLDLDNQDLADTITDDLTGWARRRNLWATSRPSGGGPGRVHVFVAAGVDSAALHTQVELWRDQAKLTSRQLDVRHTIRPFTAPHRRTAETHIPDDLTVEGLALAAAATDTVKAPARGARRPAPTRSRKAGAAGEESRSEAEFAHTVALRNAGTTKEQAWVQVSAPQGSKAKERGREWWGRYMWDRVRTRTNPGQTAALLDIARIILPTLDAHRPHFDAIHPRTRNNIKRVWMVLAEKLQTAREGVWVPISERDIHLCTGLDRRTVRAATVHLRALGVVERLEGVRAGEAHSFRCGPGVVESLDAPPILTPRPSRWLPHCPASAAHHLDLHHHGLHEPSGSTRQQEQHAATAKALRSRGVLGNRPSAQTARLDKRAWQLLLQAVTAERDLFHHVCRAVKARKARARAAATTRRQRQWWQGLGAEGRRTRLGVLRPQTSAPAMHRSATSIRVPIGAHVSLGCRADRYLVTASTCHHHFWRSGSVRSATGNRLGGRLGWSGARVPWCDPAHTQRHPRQPSPVEWHRLVPSGMPHLTGEPVALIRRVVGDDDNSDGSESDADEAALSVPVGGESVGFEFVDEIACLLEIQALVESSVVEREVEVRDRFGGVEWTFADAVIVSGHELPVLPVKRSLEVVGVQVGKRVSEAFIAGKVRAATCGGLEADIDAVPQDELENCGVEAGADG